MAVKDTRPLEVRLAERYTINRETGCWEWTAPLNNGGYGQIKMGRHCRVAHRVTYELLVGPIPTGLQLDHLCRVRHCVNPAHLEPVTARVNLLRGVGTRAATNAAKTHCPSGHEYTPENTYRTTRARYCRECGRKQARERQRRLRAAADLTKLMVRSGQ